MKSGIQMPLRIAVQRADHVIDTIKLYCEKINVAGSVRRQRQFVNDIEIVCIPKKMAADLFSTEMVTHPGFDHCLNLIVQSHIKGNSNGRYMQVKTKTGYILDLFMPQPDDYYRQFAIRTGSADFAQREIAGSWKRLGWCGTDKGLRRQEDCILIETEGSRKWKCINDNGEKPPVWKNEQEFFDWLHLPWVPPRLRF